MNLAGQQQIIETMPLRKVKAKSLTGTFLIFRHRS
jgi:hypothetical protein